jgi:Fe-S-cluster containining protein
MANIETAQTEAHENLKKLQRLIPADLQDRENRLLETFSKHKGNQLSKLHDLYGFMDELFSYAARVTPCEKGCNHCCHIPVSVSALEFEYMKNRNRKLKNKISYSDQDTSKPCPFLHKRACSIYEIRPFLCRSHVAVTATSDWCHLDLCHTIKLPQLSFTEIKKVYAQLLVESGHLARRFDIRAVHKEFSIFSPDINS